VAGWSTGNGGQRGAALTGDSHSIWAELNVCGLFSMSVGSYALLVRWNAADLFIPIPGFVYSHVFVDRPDRSDYTRAEFPSLEGTCRRPMSVSPLLHEMRGHAHDTSADHPDSRPLPGPAAAPHPLLSPPVGGTSLSPHDVSLIGIRVTRIGVCVAMERKTGKFMLIILFVGIPERPQTTLSNRL
jgi:hypothetical protein